MGETSEVRYVMRDLNPPVSGQCWKRGGKITTIRTTQFVDHETGEVIERESPISIKNASGFGSVEAAEKALATWRDLGYNGAPASAASIFRSCLLRKRDNNELPRVRARDANRTLQKIAGRWLWIESRTKGYVKRPTWHYDINEAYFWATSQGLPGAFYPYSEGDKNYVAIMDIRRAERDLPNILKSKKPSIVTSEDVRYYGLKGDIISAVSYRDLDVNLAPVYKMISKHFGQKIAKKARQTSWGLFAQNTPIYAESYTDGERTKQRTLPNPLACIPWAALISRRVVRRVHGAMVNAGGISCFVDSVLCTHRLRSGEQPGRWRLEHKFPNGIYIRSPGVYDGLQPRVSTKPIGAWYRHSGYKETEIRTQFA